MEALGEQTQSLQNEGFLQPENEIEKGTEDEEAIIDNGYMYQDKNGIRYYNDFSSSGEDNNAPSIIEQD